MTREWNGLTRRELLERAGGLAAAAWLPTGLARGSSTDLLSRAEPGRPTSRASAVRAGAAAPSAGQDFPRKADFAIPNGVTYLNGAYTHPMPVVVRDAVRAWLEGRAGFRADASRPTIGGEVKAKFAALVNADPDEIAFIPNTSAGEVLSLQALGLPRSGGNVVTDALHFEGAIVHLQALQRTAGLDVRVVMPRDGRIDLEDLERVIDDETRLVELSWVTMYNGFQHDLRAVCELAHSRGARVYADIIQGAGAVPLDVRATGVDFAACSGFKWLMGDLGLGFLYVRRDLLESGALRRPWYGYHSVSSYATHFLPYDEPGSGSFSWELGTNASAFFEVGSVAGAARAALDASLDYLGQLGVANIEAHRQPLLQRLRDELPGLRFGLECVTPEGTTSPIITFTTPQGAQIRERFRSARVDVRVADHWVRFSPSVYNDMADVERVLDVLS
jgi:selenocysteine lyase/cysteine desulfurase